MWNTDISVTAVGLLFVCFLFPVRHWVLGWGYARCLRAVVGEGVCECVYTHTCSVCVCVSVCANGFTFSTSILQLSLAPFFIL